MDRGLARALLCAAKRMELQVISEKYMIYIIYGMQLCFVCFQVVLFLKELREGLKKNWEKADRLG